MRRSTVAVALLAGLGMTSQVVAAAGNPELGQRKAAACFACHGPAGNSVVLPAPADQWPKLAGQLPEYIAKQLQDFKAGRRSNQQMSPQAQNVNDADINDIAAYFAKQSGDANAVPDKALLAEGEKIFKKGKGRPDVVAACMGCHGPSGAGQGNWSDIYKIQPSVLAPAIGGQHARYVAKQLTSFRDGSRANDTGNVMRNVAMRLNDKEIAAVAEYVSTLAR